MTIKHLFPPAWPALNLDFANSKALDPRITFTRSSIGTYIDENGIVQTAVDDEPRFDHDPVTGESLGLLIEESRTNYIQNSTDFNAGDWSFDSGGTSPGIPVCTTNFAVAPDGTNTATRTECSTGGGTTNADFSQLRCNRDSNTRAVESIWIKSNTGSDQTIFMTSIVNPVIATNTWTRWHALTNDFRIGARGDQSDQDLDILIWGAQVEAGDKDTGFSTSYIPTAGATADRSADVASITGANFSSWYNDPEGTMVTTASSFATANSNRFVYNFSGARIEHNATTTGNYQFFILGSVYMRASFSDYLPNVTYKSAFAWQDQNCAASLAGAVIQTDPGTIVVPTGLGIGSRAGGQVALNGHIARLAYYPRRLPNEQLQTLTA